MHRLRLRKKDPEDEHYAGKTDILEEDEGKDRGKKLVVHSRRTIYDYADR